MPLTVNYGILEENKFDYPFRIFISGSSQSGKTYFAKELLQNREIFKKSIKSIRYCHPDYLSELPIDWHKTIDIPVSYQSGLPSLDEICNLEEHTCLVLDDLYEEAIVSKPVDYLFRVLSGKRNISVVIMSQRYFAHGRFGMNIRNNCNFTVMMRNSIGWTNTRIAQNLNLAEAVKKALEDTYANNYYPYILIDSSPRGQVSNYRCYTSIFGKVQTVFSHRGMKAYIINEHDFLSNFNIINNSTAERKIETDKQAEKVVDYNGVDKEDNVRESNCESEQEKREEVKKSFTFQRLQKRSRELRNRRRGNRRLKTNLF